jgi:putative MATE family efflux protein
MDENNINPLWRNSTGRELMRLAIPMTLICLLQMSNQLIDAYWVGRINAAAVAAVAISIPVAFIIIAAGAGLAMAGATLTAQYAGAKQQDMVNHVATQTLLMVTILSVIIAATGYFLSSILLSLLNVSPDVYAGALGYMRITFIGLIPLFLFAMFQAIMRGVGEVKIPLVAMAGSVALNFLLDPVLIFGWDNFRGFGVRGAAWATLITESTAMLFGAFILFRGQHGVQMKRKDFKPDLPYIKSAFLMGIPASLEQAFRGIGPMIMSFLATSFGTKVIASYGIGINIMQFVSIPAVGLSMAASTMVGQSIGAEDTQRAKQAAILSSRIGFVFLSVLGIICWIFSSEIVAVLIPDEPDVIVQGATFIRIMCLSWGTIGIQQCVLSVFRAAGDMMTAMVIVLLQTVFQILLAYLLINTSLQCDGLWWSFLITNIVFSCVSIYYFSRGKWMKIQLVNQASKKFAPIVDKINNNKSQ